MAFSAFKFEYGANGNAVFSQATIETTHNGFQRGCNLPLNWQLIALISTPDTIQIPFIPIYQFIPDRISDDQRCRRVNVFVPLCLTGLIKNSTRSLCVEEIIGSFNYFQGPLGLKQVQRPDRNFQAPINLYKHNGMSVSAESFRSFTRQVQRKEMSLQY